MRRDAFTLLETVLAAALLATLAVACAGLLRLASAGEPPDASASVSELSDLADRAMRSPGALGLAGLTREGLPAWTGVPWPNAPDREPVRVEVLRGPGAAWVVFSWRGLSASRRVRTEGDP